MFAYVNYYVFHMFMYCFLRVYIFVSPPLFCTQLRFSKCLTDTRFNFHWRDTIFKAAYFPLRKLFLLIKFYKYCKQLKNHRILKHSMCILLPLFYGWENLKLIELPRVMKLLTCTSMAMNSGPLGQCLVILFQIFENSWQAPLSPLRQ